jgi:non-ribosomal peptide synthetase component F
MLAAAPQPALITVTGHNWAAFISPMGEPFRPHGADDDTLADWFRQADRNHDGVIDPGEMRADAERFFATLDTNHDGQIDPDELTQYEWEIAPDVQVNSRTKRAPGEALPAPAAVKSDIEAPPDAKERKRRAREGEAALGLGGALQGAARYALLNIPEPVAAADTDFNRSITLDEFRQAALDRFELLDSAHVGRLTLAQLEAMRPVLDAHGRVKRKTDAPDPRIGTGLPTGP